MAKAQPALSPGSKATVDGGERSDGGDNNRRMKAGELRLEEAEVKFFRDNGFLRIEALTTAEEIAEMRAALEPLFEKHAGEKEGAFADQVAGAEAKVMSAPQILNPVNYLPKLHQTKCFKNALQVAREILGPEARCFFDLSILKIPRIGAPTPWHQDEAFRDPSFEYREITVWVPLQEVKPENGCLQFIPGSHLAALLEHRSANNDPTSQAIECIGAIEEAKAVPCPLKPGGATVHGPRTLHRATPNVSTVPRYTYIMTFGVTPVARSEPRSFPWLSQKETPIQERKRKWMRRGGVVVTVWRRLRRGDLTNWRAALYGLKRSIRILRRGL
ncbi:MAG TPA: phytanoyl-CoA dioxygenase family protein [Verrucomicrobiae bacterium]|nr:phytanoyl-CoA dioxygenase family protein [Verrucomicrobiae bacterium]